MPYPELRSTTGAPSGCAQALSSKANRWQARAAHARNRVGEVSRDAAVGKCSPSGMEPLVGVVLTAAYAWPIIERLDRSVVEWQ